MLVQDNINYAKRNLIDSIWKEANLEGVGVTFPETQEIVEGRTVAGLTIKDTMVVNNLKHAWQFMFDTMDYPVDLQWISQLHYEIGRNDVVMYPGNRRESVVSIGGTEWMPEIPSYEGFKEAMENVLVIEDPTDRALEAFCVIARTQYFNDGNKRTAQLVANKILIENGCGVLAVPQKDLESFTAKLISYYESGDSDDLRAFLKDKALDCPDIQPPHDRFVPDKEKFISKERASIREAGEASNKAAQKLNEEVCSPVKHDHEHEM